MTLHIIAPAFDYELTASQENHRWRSPSSWVAPCGPGVLACHHGCLGDIEGQDLGADRILAYFGLLAGSSLIQHVDQQDLEPDAEPGTLVITVDKNATVVTDQTGTVVPVVAVTSHEPRRICGTPPQRRGWR